jgi:radical SAM protein with 4Fe4S-binding SPASM domain
MLPVKNHIKDLHATLSTTWNVKMFVDLSSITLSPEAIYQLFHKCYQPVFEPNDRLVFYTSRSISQELLMHLYRASNLIDISNFFILLCTPQDISNNAVSVAKTHFTDSVPFQTLVVPSLPDTNELSDQYTLPDTMCPLPWMHLEIKHNGVIRPCCVFQGSVGNINNEKLQNAFNNQSMRSLREEFLKGKKHPGCNSCWSNESQGLTSNRTYHAQLLKTELLTKFLSNPKITSLDIKPGNTCNFKCRICGPNSSSLHANERNQFLKINSLSVENWIDNDEYVGQLIDLLPNLKNIDMYGGEPFLIKKFNSILKTAIDKNYASGIRLHYNTNGSIYPQHLIEYWKHFQHIDIQISVDNIGQRFELERGGLWTDVENNIKKLLALNLPNATIGIMPAISIMNVFYIGELLNWAKSLGLPVYPIYVSDPAEFSIKNLTKHAKEVITKKYQNHSWPEMKNILATIESTPDNNGINFINKTQYFDSIRKENFSKSHPEIANAMGYVYNKNL